MKLFTDRHCCAKLHLHLIEHKRFKIVFFRVIINCPLRKANAGDEHLIVWDSHRCRRFELTCSIFAFKSSSRTALDRCWSMAKCLQSLESKCKNLLEVLLISSRMFTAEFYPRDALFTELILSLFNAIRSVDLIGYWMRPPTSRAVRKERRREGNFRVQELAFYLQIISNLSKYPPLFRIIQPDRTLSR